ncbi:hypothetical protein L1987_76282 [Smallanthus sonchifolius]|uniref:Uncharacterized protein n=1 Tax=Smallanthus sonchifolius TaxID=185202 RepID=A0ACB9A8R2_9ASTR|nr:hypothetical protein L1987_76282 [Smallanthus sonchifolius]
MKSDLLKFIKDYISNFFQHGGVNPRRHDDDMCLMDLPFIRFEDIQNHRPRSIDRMCFICSEDYDKDDMLCQLSRCGDIFHSDCVGKLLHRKQTSCPFCRAPIFSGLPMVSCE